MGRRNLCPKTANTAGGEKTVNAKEVWHFDDGFSKSLCGSPSRRNTPSPAGVSCPKCQEILRVQATASEILRKTTYMDDTQFCDYCGARHRLPPYNVHLRVSKRDIKISLCPHCQKVLLTKIEKEKEV